VLAVKYGTIGSIFFKNIDEFRSRRLLEANEFSTTKIDLQEPRDGKMTTVLALKRAGENRWQFIKPPFGPADYEGSPVAKQDQSVRSLIVALTSLRAEEFEPIGTGVALDEKNAKLRIELEVDGGKQPALGRRTRTPRPGRSPRKCCSSATRSAGRRQ